MDGFDLMQLKTCSKCGQKKDASEFNKNRRRCRMCRNAYGREYYRKKMKLNGDEKTNRIIGSHKAVATKRARYGSIMRKRS